MALKEAPEGIVAYSSSGVTSNATIGVHQGVITYTNTTDPIFTSKVNNGTIVFVDNSIFIDYSDGSGQNYKNTEKLVLSKNFVETLDLISEGEIEGPVSGEYIYSGNLGETGWQVAALSGYSVPTGYESSRWLRSIYYNQIPILSDKAQFNFQSVDVSFVKGLPNGDNIETLVSEETTSRGIGERLRGGIENSKFFRILNRNCKGIILNVKVPTLSETNPNNGDIGRVRLDWDISYRPIFTDIIKQSEFSEPFRETIFGKITSAGGYVKSTRIDFNTNSFFSKEVSLLQGGSNPQSSTIITPQFVGNFLDNTNFIGWEIKVTRATSDSVHSFRQDATYIDSITELYGNQFSYPNSAIIKSEFNAEFFTSVPDRLFECNLLKVKVPANYNPITRNYSLYGSGISPTFPSPSGYWKMNGNSSDLIKTYNGTDTAITYLNGQVNQCASFNGTTSRITFPTLSTTTTFSISMWIYPIPSSDDYATLFAQGDGNAGIYYRGISKKIDFYYTATDHLNNTALTENTWNHIVITCNAGNVTFYINGNSDGTSASAPSFNANTIGNDDLAEHFKGYIDELGIWNSVLSASNIATLYNAGVGLDPFKGYWNGEFSATKQWTNNPAWCFYDLLTNKRYGLGKYVDNLNIDKFTLYKIGQYCDELVYSADGGLEPRFTLNTLISNKQDAFELIHDMASVFRGLLYYAEGTLFTVSDSPKPTRVTFTNANVENGDFIYSSTSRKTRQSVAAVRYNNPSDFYKPAIEYVENIDSIRKYGIRELELNAFGCTSRGQAIRLGRWSLLTNNIENETVQFVAGLEATTLKPGDVFKVHDSNRKTKRYGGRVWNIIDSGSGAQVTLDNSAPLDSGVEYKLSVLTPSYIYSNAQVTGLNAGDLPNINKSFLQDFIFSGERSYITGARTVVNINTGFNTTDYYISGNPIWSIELGPNSLGNTGARYFINTDSDYYRVINIKENDSNKFEVAGLKYWNDKYLQIDSGVDFQRPSISYVNRTPATPTDLTLHVYNLNNDTNVVTNQQVIHYAFLMPNYNYVNNYRVYATTGTFPSTVPNNNTLIAVLPSDVIQSTYKPFDSGNWNFRVYAYNEIDKIYSNSYASSKVNVNRNLTITNVIISSLRQL